MFNYAMYLDDERAPKSKKSPGGLDWVVVRSVREALGYIRIHGMPQYMSLDHDLGVDQYMNIEPNGMEFIKAIVVREVDLPEGFDFNVHSANPIGADNMRRLLQQYKEHYFSR